MPNYFTNWTDGSITPVGTQRVYLRQYWSQYSTAGNYDSDIHYVPWVHYPQIWCENVSWSMLPSMPAAALTYRYGRQFVHGSDTAVNLPRLAIPGWWVKVEIDAPDGTLYWYGYIAQAADVQGGLMGGIPTGEQHFICHSMAQLWAYQQITKSKWWHSPATLIGDSSLYETQLGIPFNQFGRPNRSVNKPTNTPDGGPAEPAVTLDHYVFAPNMPTNYRDDGPPVEVPEYWSSRDIMEYLVQYHAPKDYQGNVRIPFEIQGLTNLPDYDVPSIQAEGRSVLDVMVQIANPSRLLQLSHRVQEREPDDPDTTLDKVIMTVHSLSDTELTLPGGHTHPANVDRLTITSLAAEDTGTVLESEVSEVSSAVAMKGERREVLMNGLFNTGPDAGINGQALLRGWTSAQETEYEDGAKNEADWNSWSLGEQQRENNRVRGKDSLANVFRTFVLDPHWNCRDFNTDPVFGFGINGLDPYIPYWAAVEIQPQIPLREQLDYSTDPFPDDKKEVEYRRPIPFLWDDQEANFLIGEKMADGVEINYAVQTAQWDEGLGISLDVNGGPQHLIAHDEFAGNTADDIDALRFEYQSSVLTFSMLIDSYLTEYFYLGGTTPQGTPQNADLLSAPDFYREKVIYAGRGFKQIGIQAALPIDLENNGDLKYTTANDQYLRDDSEALRALGQIASGWYLEPRYVFRLRSKRHAATPQCGMLVVAANGEAINTVISQITLSMPLAYQGRSQGFTYQLQTARGEADLAQFNPQLKRLKGVRRRT